MQRRKIWRLPVIRGVVALGESLAIGFRALAISANVASQERDEEGEIQTQISRGQIIFSFAIAIGFALMLFKIGPALLTSWLPVESTELSRGQLLFAFGIAIGFALLLFKVSPALITSWLPIESTGWFVVVEGLIRVTIFILYLVIVGFLPDLRRVFQYHAAEHKAINAYEAGDPLEPEAVQRHSLIHVRCGTAFLLYVMVIAIFVFAFVGQPGWFWLIASRILLLPVIAGIAYEVIRFAGKHPHNPILRVVLAPGLWLQRLTTRAPSLDQIEVSIRALHEVLRLEGRLTPEERKVEVMA
jgi:uncharacterized protein YqhQ